MSYKGFDGEKGLKITEIRVKFLLEKCVHPFFKYLNLISLVVVIYSEINMAQGF